MQQKNKPISKPTSTMLSKKARSTHYPQLQIQKTMGSTVGLGLQRFQSVRLDMLKRELSEIVLHRDLRLLPIQKHCNYITVGKPM